MDFNIKTYNSDPTIDFDKTQADIYNNAIFKYTGNTVSVDEVKQRTERDKFDHKGMLFAFTTGNKPLAYIRYYLYPSGSLYIGYPWCTPDCPSEVQEKLFTDLKKYIKEKFPEKQYARMGFADNRILPFHEFAQKKTFERDFWEDEFHIEIKKFSKLTLGEFTYQEASISDLESLVTIAMEDFEFYGQEDLLNEEETRHYYKETVFKHNNCVLLIKDQNIIGATSPIRNRSWNNSSFIFIRSESIRKQYYGKRFLLYVALAKLLNDKGLTDEKILVSKSSTFPNLIAQLEDSPAIKAGGASSYKVLL